MIKQLSPSTNRIFTAKTLDAYLRTWGFLLIFLPSLLLMIIFAVSELNSATDKTYQQMGQSLARQEQALDKWFNNCREDIDSLANFDTVKKVDKEEMIHIFTVFLHSHKYFDNIVYINQAGITEIDLQHGPELYRGDQSYFQKALSGKSYVSDIIQTKTDNQPKIIFSSPIYGASGQLQGVIVGTANFSAIDALMQEFIFSQTGETYLVNQNGLLLSAAGTASGAAEKNTALLPRLEYKVDTLAVNQALQGETSASVYTGYTNQQVFGAYRWLPSHSWAIISEVNATEVLDPIYLQLRHMFLGFLLILLISLPLSLLMSRNIKTPISHLIHGTRQMQKRNGNFFIDRALITAAPRELQELCDTFNQMAATINSHNQQLEAMVNNRTENLLAVNCQLQQQIVERQQAAALLQQSEEKYRMLVNNATDAIFLNEIYEDERNNHDKVKIGKFLEVNDIACQSLGYTKEELLQLTFMDIDYNFTTGIDVPAYYVDINSNNHTIFETIHLTKNGTTIPVEVSLQVFRLNSLPVGLSIARDISERKKVEQELARLDRLNLVGEMAANIGHEVRNPLTTVRGFLQMLGRKSENSHNAEYYNIMIDELDRANSIITEFLSMAKNKAVKMEDTSLNDIIRVLHPLLQADAIAANKQVLLALSDIPDVYIDQKEIRQLILNLARNGLEAMQSNGNLTLHTFTDTDAVVLAVQDEGSGIPQDLLDKLGTPFLTTKEQGTGLGLSICYSIAHRHGATIVLDTSNTGTTFSIRFKSKANTEELKAQ